MRIPVIVRDAYTVEYECIVYEGNPVIFVHCKIHKKWSKDIKRALTKDFHALTELTTMPLFALHDLDDPKHKRFIEMFGFTKFLQGEDLPKNRAVYILEK